LTSAEDRNRHLQQSRRRWYHDNDIIRKIFELEKELGYAPGLLDVYCDSRFTRAEIISSTLNDALYWLAAGTRGIQKEKKTGVAAAA